MNLAIRDMLYITTLSAKQRWAAWYYSIYVINILIESPHFVYHQVTLQPEQSGRHFASLIARFMGPTWGPSRADRTQVGPMLAPWTLLSGIVFKWMFSSINVCVWIKMHNSPNVNTSALVYLMVWCWTDGKPSLNHKADSRLAPSQ